MIGGIKASSVTSDQANRVKTGRTTGGSIRPNDSGLRQAERWTNN